jgi:predicted DCC family thiol-disulfide oxidoreductase YuxK
MPPALFAVAWVLMALGYSYSGYTKLSSPSWLDGTAFAHVLENPLARPTALREWLLALPAGLLKAFTWGALGAELAFAPLALVRPLRPWLWLLLLGMHVDLMILVDFTDLSLGMVMLHFFTLDPAWVRPRAAPAAELLLYDGHCGLCHRWIRFVLAADRAEAFRFAPLGGEAFAAAVPEAARASLPDSVVVVTAGGGRLVRSRAALYILARLGGLWRVLGGVARVVPRPILDAAYDGVAGVRHRLFARPTDACPVVAPELRTRFLG